MDINSIKSRIAFEFANFLNQRSVESTVKIEISLAVEKYLITNFHLQHSRYSLGGDLVRHFNLTPFIRAQINQFNYLINRIEFKLNKRNVKIVQKRKRTLKTYSPIYLSLRMIKARQLINQNVLFDEQVLIENNPD